MKHLRQEHGYAMLLVILTTVLISVIGLGLLTMNANSVKTSKNEEVDQAVFYIAESGLTYRILEIESDVNQVYNDFITKYNDANNDEKKVLIDGFPNNFYDQLELSILAPETYNDKFSNNKYIANVFTRNLVIIDENTREYEVVSTGKIDAKKRTVSQIIIIKLPSVVKGSGKGGGEYAVHTLGDITLKGSASIIGKAATESGIIKLSGSASITDKIGTTSENLDNDTSSKSYELIGFQTVPTNILPSFPDTEYTDFTVSLNYPSIPYPPVTEIALSQYNKTNIIDNSGNFHGDNWMVTNYVIDMNEDMRFNNFSIGSGKTITINIGNSDKNLYLESLKNSSGTLNIIGSGKLNVYAKKFETSSGTLNIKNNGEFYIHANELKTSSSTVNFENNGNLNINVKNFDSSSSNLNAKNSGKINIRSNSFIDSSSTLSFVNSNDLNIYSNIFEASSSTLNAGNSGDFYLYSNTFGLKESGSLNLSGSGELDMFVKNKFVVTGSSSINKDGDSNKAFINYAGTDSLDLGGNLRINSNLYTKSSNIKFGGSISVLGDIYSGGTVIDIAGASISTGQNFYAPNAKITLGGSGHIKGRVISKEFEASGSAKVTFSNDSTDESVPKDGDVVMSGEKVFKIPETNSGSFIEE